MFKLGLGQRSRRVLTATAAIALAATLAVNNVHAGSHSGPMKGGTLTVGVETDSRGFDAVKGGVLGISAGTVSLAIHDTLLKYNEKTKEFEPNLATAWEASEDNKSWTLTLRQGVKFHDGSDFTAKDVADHFNRILDPENKSRSRSFITAITGVEAIDDHTVKFNLAHPWLPLLGNLAAPSMIGLIPSSANVAADKQNREPIGTGPFMFDNWAGGDRITVKRNPNYWNKDAVHLDEIVFRILPDTQARFASLRSGEIDLIWTDRGSSIVDAQKDPKLTTVIRDGKGAAITFINASKPPLDDARVRQAISHAWNQTALLKVTWKDTRPFAEHPLGTDSTCDAGYRHYDPAKAKALLADYGKPVKISMIHTTTPRGREFGEIYQQLLKQVGVELELVPVDQNTLVKKVFTNDYMISGWRIADAEDVGPQTFALSYSKSSYNLSHLSSPEMDKVAFAMRTAAEPAVREKFHCDLMRMVNDQGNMQYRGGNRYYAFHGTNTHNIGIDGLGVVRVSGAWKDK